MNESNGQRQEPNSNTCLCYDAVLSAVHGGSPMKSSLLSIVCLVGTACLTLLGCTAVEVSSSNSSGTVGISNDDAFVYAVDTDNGVVAIVDAKTQSKITSVPVGSLPERIAVGADDTIYVANRGSRSVSVIHRGTTDPGSWNEATRINVGVEPVGLALSPDGKTLYVVNSTSLQTSDYGTVMSFDTASLQMKWELPVGQEPRSIAVVGKDRAVVTLFKQGDIVLVDLSKPEVLQAGTTLYQLANRPPDPSQEVQFGPGGPSTSHARGMGEVVPGPSDGRIYALTSWSSEATLQAPPPAPPATIPVASCDPSYGGSPSNSPGVAPTSCPSSVVSAGVVTFQDQGATPLVDSLQGCGTQGGMPPTRIVTGTQAPPMQGPSAIAIDPTGNWMFVVGRNSNDVVVLPTAGSPPSQNSSVASIISVGQGPSGIAVTHDGARAYVYNSFDHQLSVLEGTSGGINVTATIPVAQDVLSPNAVEGRELFFSAINPVMTSSNVAIACASCHLEGREDGHVWQFSEGPRRTPSLAGRATTLTPPFHWSGEFATLDDFLNGTIIQRMGGSNTLTAMTVNGSTTVTIPIAAYIDSLKPLDNPQQLATPTDAQVRGKAVFATAACSTCHAGTATDANGQTVQLFTNNGFANVGTLVTSGNNPDDPTQLQTCSVSGVSESACLNVPSLLGLARSAPYLHDGSAATFMDRLRVGQSTNQHGQTANLSDQQLSDLVEYLKSL
jgi:YVTN family beta-propeller protein